MKFNHKVKHNGKIYSAGAEVPVDGEKKTKENVSKEDVEKMSARIIELDNIVMERNSEIQTLKEENAGLKAKIEELETASPPEDTSDGKSESGASEEKQADKPVKQKKPSGK